jgi:hypothetical protein
MSAWREPYGWDHFSILRMVFRNGLIGRIRRADKAMRGKIQPNLKTKHGERDTDLCTPLAAMLRDFIGSRALGLLFCTSTGKQLLQSNTLQDSLHPILKKIEPEKGWVQHLSDVPHHAARDGGVPEGPTTLLVGTRTNAFSERYKKLLKQHDWRLEWAERIGLGLELPAGPVAPYAPVIVLPKAG